MVEQMNKTAIQALKRARGVLAETTAGDFESIDRVDAWIRIARSISALIESQQKGKKHDKRREAEE